MAVQTSQVTTASNGTLQLNPNGSGKVRLNKLGGAGNQPVGVDNNGDTKKFIVSELGARTPETSDFVMIQQNSGSTVTRCSLDQAVSAGGGIKFSNLSVSTGGASGGGALAYNNTNGVFTFSPASLGDMGGITLSSLSVTSAAASGGGALSYNNSNGRFTFTPASIPSLADLGGITLSSLSVTVGAATTGGALTYNNSNGVFTYQPASAGGVTAGDVKNGVGVDGGDSKIQLDINSLSTR